MQSINLILVSLVTTFCLPLVLLLLSGYTLYNSIAMASYAKRRNAHLFQALSQLGRHANANGH